MDTQEYAAEALQTWKSSGDWTKDQMYLSLGICKEGGEAAQLIAKWAMHGKNFDTADLKDELGDVLWYVTVLAYENSLHLGDIMDRNIAKLRERHGDKDVREHYASK